MHTHFCVYGGKLYTFNNTFSTKEMVFLIKNQHLENIEEYLYIWLEHQKYKCIYSDDVMKKITEIFKDSTLMD